MEIHNEIIDEDIDYFNEKHFQLFLDAIPKCVRFNHDEEFPIKPRYTAFHWQIYFVVLYYCAIRLAEAKRLRKKDFDLEKGFLTVPNRKGGYNKTTIAPPARPVLDIFLKRFNDNDLIFPMTRTAAWQVCKESGVIAKIKYFEIQEVREIDGLYTYLFKHAYEQRMEELGAQQTLISMKLRHSAQGKNRNQVTERYGMRWRRLMIWEKEKITEKLNLT